MVCRERHSSVAELKSSITRHAGRRAVLLARWIVRSRPLEIVESNGHEKVPTRGKPVWSDQEDHEKRGSKDRAASTCGPHSDSFNDTSRRPFLNGLPGAIFQQDNARPHTARVAQDFLNHFQTLPLPARSSHLSPEVHVWDQLKRQMPSCYFVHDLEMAVQDFGPICLRTT
ncbi:DDE_3 domain-containing protein [Trichonephila clavipes]|nr:DDE_3 domain-containing protein [Trichonephila clavipes]